MLLHLSLVAACVLGIEIFSRSDFPSILRSILEIARKASHVIAEKKISDHWKEKVVPKYAISMLKKCLHILAILFLIILVFFLISLVSDELITYTLSPVGLAESVVIAYVYIKLRRAFSSE